LKIEGLKCYASFPPLVGVTTGPRLVLEHALARGDTTGLKGRGCCCCGCASGAEEEGWKADLLPSLAGSIFYCVIKHLYK